MIHVIKNYMDPNMDLNYSHCLFSSSLKFQSVYRKFATSLLSPAQTIFETQMPKQKKNGFDFNFHFSQKRFLSLLNYVAS